MRRNKRPNPPPAEPVACIKRYPIGWPLGTASNLSTSGITKRIGMRKTIPVTPAMTTESTIAFGTSRSGFWTSSHMDATIP